MRTTLNKTTFWGLISFTFCTLHLGAQTCPGLGSLNLNVVAAPNPTLTAPAQICPGTNATVTVTQAFSSYSWSTGGSGQSISINNGGSFTVTVTNAAGCSATATTNVVAAPVPVPNVIQAPYGCNGSLSLDAGAGYDSYQWSAGGGNNQTATYLNGGTYTVTVTNDDGCTGTDNITVSVPPAPTTTITGSLVFCSGLNTTLNATGGFAGYAWSSGSNAASTSVDAGGSYTVTVSDAFGCTATASATVNTIPSPAPVVNNALVCIGGTVTLSVANPPFQSYNWSTGGSGSTTIANAPGNYTVTVTATNGCTGTAAAFVAPLPEPVPVIDQATYTCNGQIVLNLPPGFTTYNWSTGSSTTTTTVNASGNYSVTVTNSDGCTGTDLFAVTIPVPPVVNITGDANFCSGNAAELDATPGLNTYNWSNGEATASINVINAGTYTVTATDIFGCSATDNFVVAELTPPQPTVTGIATICDGTSSTFSTSSTYNAYSWSSGQNTPTISVNTAGNYTVTVTAANGCTGTDVQTLNVTPTPTPAIQQSVYACDDQLILNAGSGFSTYLWSNGISNPSIVITNSGNYTVTVTNAQGCTGTDVYSADIPVPPYVEITGNANICPGSTTLLSASPGFDQYVWSNSATDPDISVSAGGNYDVTVTDAFGCTTTTEYGVTQTTAPLPNISGPSQICASSNATFSVPGSFSTFVWSTGDITPSITVNTAGLYTVTVTAANGCTGTDSQTLTISTNLQPQITTLPYTCNEQITLDAGTGFSTYTWGNGESTQSIVVTANGDYSVSVSDASGCTGSALISASIPAPPAVSITGNANICAGSATTLSATPGLSAYLWNLGQVGETISASTAGTYTVTATDAQGCTVSNEFVLSNNPAPLPVITGPAVVCINSSGTLAITNTFSQYLWTTGETTATITVSSGNLYGVTVTDAAGCTGTTSQLVSQVTALTPTITQLPYTCTGTQTLDAGSGFSSYLWTGGASTPSVTVNTAGNYTVTVTDASGCTGTGTLDVNIPALPQVTITGATSFCQNTSTTLEASAGFAAYNWNTGAVTSTVSAGNSGIFSVTVTDNIGCTDTETITVVAQPLPAPSIAGPGSVCAGTSATLTASPGFSAYLWDNSTANASISINTAGTYTVTVTDANGCTGTANATLTVNPNPSTAISQEPYACDAQITLTADTGFSTYTWGGPNGFSNNNPQVLVASSGSYTVTVTDGNGCTATAVQSVTVPTLTQVAVSGTTQVCLSGTFNMTASPGFTGYAWSNGLPQPNLTVTAPGTYTVTATDALGCSSTASATLSNFPTPMPSVAGPLVVCPGNSATMSIVGNFSSFLWNSGETSASITVLPPYSGLVTVTDFNGCTTIASVNVGVSNQLSPNIVALPYTCNGQITLDAGAGFPSYNWSNAAGTSSITVTQSGTYTVTVSDGNGCSGTATTQITVPVNVAPLAYSVPSLCPGASITSVVTNQSNFVSFAWSTGGTGPSITGVIGGETYTVTVTDANGCTQTTGFSIALAPVPTPSVSTLPYTCNGQMTLDAGAGFASYAWAGPNGFSANIPQLVVNTAGTYSVTVTNNQACPGTATAQITIPALPTTSITGANLLCAGSSTTLSSTAGFSTYNWSNGSNGVTALVQAAGAYGVTVTDNIGCTATAVFQVQAAPPATVNIAGSGAICDGSSTVLTASGSAGTYTWSDGSNGSTINVASAGNYSVTLTDGNACTAVATQAITVAQPVSTTQNKSSCRPQDAGTQVFTFSAASGCDSIVTVITSYQPTQAGLALDMATEIEAEQGELLSLEVTGNFLIDSVAFISLFTLSCSNCINPSLTATETGFIEVFAFNDAGCQASESIQILVNQPLHIYVPNAFQPGSTENGYFSVYSDQSITSVQNFNVFDRWGNALFQRKDMPTNEPSGGWDGSFRGQKMQPGVYVYYFEVTLKDGKVELFSGDVTIIE